MVFLKNVLKWLLLPILSVKTLNIADGIKLHIYRFLFIFQVYILEMHLDEVSKIQDEFDCRDWRI